MHNRGSSSVLGLRYALLGFLLALQLAAQRSPDVQVNKSAPGSRPQMAVSGSSVYVTWVSANPTTGRPNVFFNRSNDCGATWLATDLRVNTNPAAGAVSYGAMIAASGSSVYVAWYDYRNSFARADIYFNRSLDRGATWLANDIQLNTDPAATAHAWFPSIAATGSSVYVAWEDNRNNSLGDIYFNRSIDSGATWLAPDVRLDTDPGQTGYSRYPQVSASGSSVYVVWWDSRNGLSDIFLNRSTDSGATWLRSDLRLDTSPAGTRYSHSPQLAVSGSSVYVTWIDHRRITGFGVGRGDVYFNYSKDGGATWQANDIRLDRGPTFWAFASAAQIAASGSSVYVTWRDSRNGVVPVDDIYFNHSLDGGGTWLSRDVLLNTNVPGTANSGGSRIGASGTSVYVTWPDDRNGLEDVYINYSSDNGTTWLVSDMRINSDPAGAVRSLAPGIAATGSSVYVTWVDVRSGLGPDVYLSIPFGFMPFCSGTAGSGGLVPTLNTTGRPTRGDPVALNVSNGLGGAPGAWSIGVGAVSKVSIPLLGGTLCVVPTVSLSLSLGGSPGTPGAGSATLPLTLPITQSVIGLNINFQAFLLDAGAPQGVSMTNGVEMWIG